MQVREPVARPLDVVALELLLSGSQALLVGVLAYLAVGIWEDQGVAVGPVAIILLMLALTVAGTWLFWLFGGVGWPLAAANVPVVMFLGFVLVLGWVGDDLLDLSGVPLVLAAMASTYGIVGGVFIDSPRRWRWDQRQRLRPGTKVPRVSPTTKALIAQVPRRLARQEQDTEATSELAARIEQSAPPSPAPSVDSEVPAVGDGDATGELPRPISEPDATRSDDGGGHADRDDELTDAPDVKGAAIEAQAGDEPVMPTPRLSGKTANTAASLASQDAESDAIELPTSVEPRAQRSPWAWAAPPDWNEDEDDDGAAPGSAADR